MSVSGFGSRPDGHPFPGVVQGVAWLRRHRDRLLAFIFLSIAMAFVLDLLIPGYAIAGFYLIPLLLVALAMCTYFIVTRKPWQRTVPAVDGAVEATAS